MCAWTRAWVVRAYNIIFSNWANKYYYYHYYQNNYPIKFSIRLSYDKRINYPVRAKTITILYITKTKVSAYAHALTHTRKSNPTIDNNYKRGRQIKKEKFYKWRARWCRFVVSLSSFFVRDQSCITLNFRLSYIVRKYFA